MEISSKFGRKHARQFIIKNNYISYEVYATQYWGNTNYEVALPDKYLKFANRGWSPLISGYNYGSNYSVYLERDGYTIDSVLIWDVGPWNEDDNYWNPSSPTSHPRPRRMFTDLPQGISEAQAAYFNDYNDGKDQFGRIVTNPAGIDLTPAVAADLGLAYLQNDWVTVTYLWEEASVLPPTVETRPASFIEKTSAFLNGEIVDDGGSSIIERRFDWGITSSGADWTDWTANVGVLGDYFSYYLTGLKPDTTYYFWAWAKNSEGWSNGDILSFKTLVDSDTIPPLVNTFFVSPDLVILGNSFNISYTVSDNIGLKQTELWRANDVGGTPDWPSGPIQVTPLSGQKNYSGSFTDIPDTAGTYWYGMHVVDNVGNWSCEPDPPGPIKVTVVSPTRIIRLEGNLNFGDIQVGSSSQRTLTIYNDGNSTLTVTRIDYPTGFSGDWLSEVSIPEIDGFIPAGSSQNVTVTFAPTQVVTYGGYLTVNSDATSGANTKLVSGTGIPSTSSPQVTTNDASNITSTSAQLNGNLDSTGNLSCQVWFEYGKTISYGDSTPKESKSSVGFFNDTVYSLDPNTIYHFRACASNTEGTVYGADKTFNTPMLGDFGCANDGPPDCKVDFEDLMIFALAYGSTPSDTNWNPVCDIASLGGVLETDSKIDFEDLIIFAMHYGETCADL